MRLDGLGHYYTNLEGREINILIPRNSPAWDKSYITPILQEVAHPTKYALSTNGKMIGYFNQLIDAYNEAKFLISIEKLDREG